MQKHIALLFQDMKSYKEGWNLENEGQDPANTG